MSSGSSFDDASKPLGTAEENVAGKEPAFEATQPVPETHISSRLTETLVVKFQCDIRVLGDFTRGSEYASEDYRHRCWHLLGEGG